MMFIYSANNKRAFALLYAVLISGVVLAVGVSLMDIITKQLVFSSISKSSESAYYYAAYSGANCLYYLDSQDDFMTCRPRHGLIPASCAPTNPYPGSLNCFNPVITPGPPVSLGSGQWRISIPADLPSKPSDAFDLPSSPAGNFSLSMTIYKNTNCILGRMTNHSYQCTGPNLIDRKGTVIVVDGYNLPKAEVGNPRRIKRTVLFSR